MKRGEQGTKEKDPCPHHKIKIINQMAKWEEWEKVMCPNPHVTRSMLRKEKGGTLEKTPSLEELLLVVSTYFEINSACTC